MWNCKKAKNIDLLFQWMSQMKDQLFREFETIIANQYCNKNYFIFALNVKIFSQRLMTFIIISLITLVSK
jgi:hypothetical protein